MSSLPENNIYKESLKEFVFQLKKINSTEMLLDVEAEISGQSNYFTKLTESEIRENADYLDWNYISRYSSLYIIKNLEKDYSDDINWSVISGRLVVANFSYDHIVLLNIRRTLPSIEEIKNVLENN